MKTKLSSIKDDLPTEAARWINGLKDSQKYGLEVVLNNAGVESFVEHWKEHRDDLKDIEDDFGKL